MVRPYSCMCGFSTLDLDEAVKHAEAHRRKMRREVKKGAKFWSSILGTRPKLTRTPSLQDCKNKGIA